MGREKSNKKDRGKNEPEIQTAKPKNSGNILRTQANKARRVARQERLAARPDSEVSRNCLKSRQKRRRMKDWKLHIQQVPASKRRISPSALGQKQFRPREAAEPKD